MSAFPDNFFEALAREGGDAAMHTLRDAAFESGLEQEPSPRAQPFFVRVSRNPPILPSILVGNKKEGTGGTFDWLKGYLKTMLFGIAHASGCRQFC